MTHELREPLKNVAHEWCACGKISLAPAQWDVIQAQTRKWRKSLPHSPARYAGCTGVDEAIEEAAADTRSGARGETSPAVETHPTVGSGAPREPDQPPLPWSQRKDKELGLFLDLPGLKPG